MSEIEQSILAAACEWADLARYTEAMSDCLDKETPQLRWARSRQMHSKLALLKRLRTQMLNDGATHAQMDKG